MQPPAPTHPCTHLPHHTPAPTWSKSIRRSRPTPERSSRCAAWLPTPCTVAVAVEGSSYSGISGRMEQQRRQPALLKLSGTCWHQGLEFRVAGRHQSCVG